MDALAQRYNVAMQQLTAVYNNSPRRDFGVIFQAMGIDCMSFFDC